MKSKRHNKKKTKDGKGVRRESKRQNTNLINEGGHRQKDKNKN